MTPWDLFLYVLAVVGGLFASMLGAAVVAFILFVILAGLFGD